MSRGQRLGLLAAALVIAVVTFVVAKPSSDDDSKQQTTTQAADRTDEQETAKPRPSPEPRITRVRLEAHQPVGGPKSIKVKRGERVRVVVASDSPDEVHLHGYDITRGTAPGRPARFSFKANLEGAFDMESHESEAKVVGLQVEPR